ncbi:F-box/kelch-repeat-like protein [Cinnamomum micranthum f. kanehirae]|uniref:F-box/kelch-repeat-like protein n=1 Tax=Cinnamomum micranthum f. kanehirae TaxID=337451 RepID=A0A3S3Q1T9_9MAGN|nr:F-box/kelch-repeat-like protein [Cinnamomum micranthum f. kanehirae]
MELIPGLPEEIGLECLIRLPYTCHHAARSVCKRWRELIDGRDFFQLRKQSGTTHVLACLVQSSPAKVPAHGKKPSGPPAYRLTVFDALVGKWECLPAVPIYPDGLPLFCQLVGLQGKLVVMGGWDPSSWDPVRHVFIYDFTRREWRQGRDMPAARSFFAAGAVDDRLVVVAGGHDENKNALKTASVYDVETDEWEAAAEMEEERDECEGVVVGGEFWVVSGYRTDRQGSFSGSAEVYESATGWWRRVEEAWEGGKCPRGRVKVERSGRVGCWSEEETLAVQVAVGMGDRALLTGSACHGAAHGFFLVVEQREGQNGKIEKMDAGEEFSGFVQSGCCIEI